MTRYLIQELSYRTFDREPYKLEPPQGYRLNSWHEKLYGPEDSSRIIVCWEREPPTSQVLAHVPHEWLTPLAEFVKRWMVKG